MYPNDDKSPAHAHSPVCLYCLHKELLHPWLSKIRPVKILIRWRFSQVDLSLRWVCMSDGMSSDVRAYMYSFLDENVCNGYSLEASPLSTALAFSRWVAFTSWRERV